jgi:protease-4
MSYPRIISKVYNEPWCITPAKHRAIQRALEYKLAGMPMPGMPEPEDGDPEDEEMTVSNMGGVAVIPIHGILGKHLSGMEMMCGGCSVDSVCGMIESACDDELCKAIVLDINSPGGTVTGIPELANCIAECATEKPVYAFTDSECCSAAYWLASQCTAIYATPSSSVGSIGVYVALLDESRALEDAGIKVNAISAGKWKLSGAPFRPLSEDERAMFQAGVDKTYAAFKAAVTSKRQCADEVMQGQSFDGDDAVTAGLVDGLVNDIDEVVEFAAALTEGA